MGAGKTVRTSVLLPEATYSQVQALAAANDVSTAWVVRQAILHYLADIPGQSELPLPMKRG